ncbi:tRNA(Arg) A34 adenosine deaminase TadA [Varunaivibrio sulfuroxidans]|uniref:tRNA-specific adenosine deaminase n=2 Tax=Varunaivibrio sulfuroxidans TaxID=1773489 RepID=A0A4R3J498_9PROT|nr:nucleoside deaminase [Varunaivibrio sulfuroxidans]TCS60628.1 tRNA(Arg) A34 adenosine deaminase TadA [Varunaivibrio sulfuroxidans]
MMSSRNCWMDRAFDAAAKAGARGEVPVGAVLVDYRNDRLLSACANRTEELSDPTAHAEILAIRRGGALIGSPRLPQCDLYVTLEPCPMCAAAISLARIRRVYFAAYDPKGGGVDHGARIFDQATCHHRPEVYGGIDERRGGDLLRRFFQARR